MPPRKKATAAAADGAKPAPTRASMRTRAPSAKAAAVAAVAAAPAAPAKAPTTAATKPTAKAKGKGKGKRAREESDDEDAADAANDQDEEEEEEKPKSKRARKDTSANKGKDKDKVQDGIQDGDAPAKAKGGKKPASKKTKDAGAPDLPQKMVTVVKRGAAPVDAMSGLVDTHSVLVTPEGVWDAMLNQTDLGKNANKFYVLQLLHPIGNSGNCVLFTRWGRVGENGQSQKKGPWPPGVAVSEFKKQFKAKAGVDWEARVGMAPKKGKYVWLERSYDDEDDSVDANGDSGSGKRGESSNQEDEKIPDSTLSSEIQTLCRLIFNSSLLDAHLSSMNYDANKLPLGKLAKSTILNGFAALKTLSEVIAQPDGDSAKSFGGFRPAVQELTGRYYSIIPHVFGRERPIVIDNIDRLKKELELVDALGDMEVASKLIASSIPKDADGRPVNPLDAHFRSLQLSKMDPVAHSSAEFTALQAYTRDTHGATHRHYGVEVLHAFRVERESETEAWTKAGFGGLPGGDRMLLWHGSRTTNFAGILKQGLRIAPPEAPVTGYMFGKGVYFADMMSKSANYCHAYLSDNTGLLLLCEVAARPFYEQHQANYNADEDCKKAGAKATKGLGRSQPAQWQDAGDALNHPELRGCHMPKGPAADVSDAKIHLQYNEYIVYDASQIRLRYLLMVKMG